MNASFKRGMVGWGMAFVAVLVLAGGETGAGPQLGFHTYCRALNFTPDGKYLIVGNCEVGSGSSSGRLAALDVSQKKWVEFKTTGDCFACFPDSRTVVVGGPDSALEFCDLRTGKVMRAVKIGGKNLKALSLSTDGKLLLCAEDGGLVLRDADTGKEVMRFRSGGVLTCALSPDGTRALSASAWTQLPTAGRDAVLWDCTTGKALWEFSTPGGAYVSHVAFSPDGNQALCVGAKPTILDCRTGKTLRRLELPGIFGCWSACFAPTGRYVLTGSMSEPPRLIEVATGKVALELKHNEHWAKVFGISADGRLAASAGNQHTPLVLWDLRTGRAIWSFDGLIRGD